MPVDTKICYAAEVGLSGEIRAVNRIEQRIAEAEKLGFEQIFISKYNLPSGRAVKTSPEWQKYKIAIKTVAKVEEVFNALFG